jgi:hypothetical protein
MGYRISYERAKQRCTPSAEPDADCDGSEKRHQLKIIPEKRIEQPTKNERDSDANDRETVGRNATNRSQGVCSSCLSINSAWLAPTQL